MIPPKKNKNGIDSPTFIRRSVLVICPLLFALDLVLKFRLDESEYCALVENNLLTI